MMSVSSTAARCAWAMLVAFSLAVGCSAAAEAPLVNPGFEEVDADGGLAGWQVLVKLDRARYGPPDFALGFDQIAPVRAASGRTGDHCAAFPAEGAWRAPVYAHSQGQGADQPDGKRRGKAALRQTVDLEPGTYRFSAYLRTAEGAQWSAGFRLGWSLSGNPEYAHDGSTGIRWTDVLAVRNASVGRLSERGEWWPYFTEPFTLERAAPVTVWIRLDYVNENQFDTRWEVDDARIVREEAEPPGGVLYGVVRDLHDRPLAEVEITLDPGGRSAVTDVYGRFALRGLPADRYSISAKREGCRLVTYEPDPVEVTVDHPVAVEVFMRAPREES